MRWDLQQNELACAPQDAQFAATETETERKQRQRQRESREEAETGAEIIIEYLKCCEI